jgi:hypothetical protein
MRLFFKNVESNKFLLFFIINSKKVFYFMGYIFRLDYLVEKYYKNERNPEIRKYKFR